MLVHFDARRDLFIGDTEEEAIAFAVESWIHRAERAIQQKGRFAVALSGGSTPKAIYQKLAQTKAPFDWKKVFLFWSDERAVPPSHPESNYKMAIEALAPLPIPPSQIFRMKGEGDLEKEALFYEETLLRLLGPSLFDLVMLGMGEDGHTASLFPNTSALKIEDRLVAANFIPEKESHRLTLTFPCIEKSKEVMIYALGPRKGPMLEKVLHAPLLSPYPASRLGTPQSKALWILDQGASHCLHISSL